VFVNHRHDDRPVRRPRRLPHRTQVRCDSAITGHVDYTTPDQGVHRSGWDRSDDARPSRVLRHVGKPGIAIGRRVSVPVHVLVAFSLADVLLNPHRDGLRIVSEVQDLRGQLDRVVEPTVSVQEEADYYRGLSGVQNTPRLAAGVSRAVADADGNAIGLP
jgi:hypothetical protein